LGKLFTHPLSPSSINYRGLASPGPRVTDSSGISMYGLRKQAEQPD